MVLPARLITGVVSRRQKIRKPCGAEASASATTSDQAAPRAANSARRFSSSAGTAASYRARNSSYGCPVSKTSRVT